MKKISFMIAAVLSMSSLLAACGGNGGSETNSGGSASAGSASPNSASTAPTSNAANEPATLVFYTDEAGVTQENFDQWIGNPMKAKYPNYTLKYIPYSKDMTLDSMITTGQTFDIFFSTGSNTLAQYGLQYDMNEMIKKHSIDLSTFEDSLINAVKQSNNGTTAIYGLPVWTDELVMFYNKDLFDKFGVSYPTNGMTWDQVLDLNKKLTRVENDTTIIGLTFNTTHMVKLNQYSLPFIDEKSGKPTINTDPRWKNIYQIFENTAQDQVYQTLLTQKKNFLYTPDFLSGKVAMLVGNSNISYIYPTERLTAFNWDMVSMPTFPDAPNVGSQPLPWFFSITSKSANKDASAEAIKFLTSEEYQTKQASELGRVPVLKSQAAKSAIGKDMAIKGKNFSALVANKMAAVAYQSPYVPVVRPIYAGAGIDVALKKTDINSAFRSIEEQANKEIEKAKSGK